MEPIDVTAYVLHSVFAGLWTGSVLFLGYGVLPAARDGGLDAASLHAVAGKLKRISRISAVVLLGTGVYMVLARYPSTQLLESTDGYLVVSMLVLWVLLMGAVEMGAARLTSGTGRDKVREPARESRSAFLVAVVLALLLLANAGLLSASKVGLL